HRGPHVHRRGRQAQHARRRVLHRPDRGLGGGRDHLPSARLLRGARGGRSPVEVRGGQGRGRERGEGRGLPDPDAGHRRGRAPARRARDRHELRHHERNGRDPARREDRRDRPPGGGPLISRHRRRQRVGDPLGHDLRPPQGRPDRGRRRGAAARRAVCCLNGPPPDRNRAVSRRTGSVIGGITAAAALLFAAQGASADTFNFGFTGGEQTFTVPSGVTSIRVIAIGGHGGIGAGGTAGGFGGWTVGDVAVKPGQTLFVDVGGNGGNA